MQLRTRPIRILTFDCESRPLGWIGADFVHQEVTCIAWAFNGGEVEVRTLSKDDRSRKSMLVEFRRAYDQAGLVTGHYIRKFDLPLVSAMLVECGEPPLEAKLVQDTKEDLLKFKGWSKSQENLSELLGVEAPKVHMNVPRWREANRLTRKGVEASVERAAGDVLQNMELRRVLLERRLLGPPRMWQP